MPSTHPDSSPARSTADPSRLPVPATELRVPVGGYRLRRRPKSRHKPRRLVVTALVILLLVPAGVLALRSLAVALMSDDSVTSSQRPPAKPTPSTPKIKGNDPFFDTPASAFVPADQAVVAPQVGQLGEWAPEKIGDALGRTRQLLLTARTDPRLLDQGDNAPYVEQVSESARGFIQEKFGGDTSLGYVTRLGQGYSLRAPVRAAGEMSVVVGDKQQLVITTNYVWVYALKGPVAKNAERVPGYRLVVIHSVENYEFYPDRGYSKSDRGLRPGDGKQSVFNVDCELTKQGQLALPTKVPAKRVTAPVAEAYDVKTTPDQLPGTC